MNIFSNRKLYIILALVISLLTALSFYYFNYVNDKKSVMQTLNYEVEAASMQDIVAQKIYEKQKATTAIGLVMAQEKNLVSAIKNRTINDTYYKDLIQDLKKDTEYKNIWINIIDNKLNSVYRSWTDKRGDSLKNVRTDLEEVIKTKKVTYTISSGKFTIAIKALIPIKRDGKVEGVLELISHFNSITTSLKKLDIDSVVVLNKKHTQKLQYPFTGKFLEGHYVANFDAPEDKLEYLHKHHIENYLTGEYKLENNYIISAYPLVSFDEEVIGYYIMFKKFDNVSSIDEDFYIFKWGAIGFIIILLVVVVINIILFYVFARQKNYIRNIVDSSTNIVVINDKKQILDVNSTFFKYFTDEHTLEEFQEKYACICDLFVYEEGYIAKRVGDDLWIDYVLEHNDETNKVKIEYDDNLYFFSLSVSVVSEEKGLYSAIFTDITTEESYKNELEKLTVTDALTGIGNRRYFTTKLEDNITLSKRYKFPLSFIMMDIDHFKQVNDKHGHSVGDEVLVEYTKLISTIVREADVFCRMGGEEFMIMVPYADLQKARILAEKIRRKVEEHKVVLPITMSFGVTEYIKGEDADHILIRVDEALYEAKENGRNQVVSK